MKMKFVCATALLLVATPLVASEGEALFNKHCDQCHSLPKMSDRTQSQIEMIVTYMQRTMEHRNITPLTENEQTELLAYLQQGSSEQSNPASDAFDVYCGLCHQAPEASMFKLNQWKIVVKTMEQRIQQANMPPLSEEQKTLVMEYLGQHSRK